VKKAYFKNIWAKIPTGFIAAACLVNIEVAFAQEPAAFSTVPVWKGQGEFGYVHTSGNTDTRTIGAKLAIERQYRLWRYSGRLEALSSSNQDVQIAERYFLNLKTDYALEDRNYLAVILEYDDARFSGYDYRIDHTLAYGRKFIDRPRLLVNGEFGIGGRRGREENGAKQDEATLRASANVKWNISESASLAEEFSVVAGEEDTVTRSITGLTSRINGNFATKLTYLAKRTTRAVSEVQATDTETTMTLVYNF
jgi:putative salt-induced outer membrane protein